MVCQPRHRPAPRGATILYGTLPFDAGVPVTPARLAGLPVFVAQGDQDTVIPRELLEGTWSYLLGDETSVERLLAVRCGSHKRAWSEATAWGAVALLSGDDAEWMGETQRSRLKGRLRRLGAAELVERARERAEVARYRAHSSAGRYLLAELVGVVSRHGLIRDDEGRVTLRATSMDLDAVRDVSERSVVLAALDLAESLDVRERRAGLDVLDRALESFRG